MIGFAEWIVEDEGRRKKGLEQAKRDMGWAAEIGGPRIAAPPVGATGGASKRDDPKFTQPVDRPRRGRATATGRCSKSARRWASRRSSRCGASRRRCGGSARRCCVAAESGDRKACVLPDVYHLYKGGSDFAGLPLCSAPRDRHLPRQRLPEDRPRQDHRRGPRVPRRRHRPAEGRVRRCCGR